MICIFYFYLLIPFNSVPNYPSVLFQIAPSCTNLPHTYLSLYFVFSQNIWVHHMKTNVFIGNLTICFTKKGLDAVSTTEGRHMVLESMREKYLVF